MHEINRNCSLWIFCPVPSVRQNLRGTKCHEFPGANIVGLTVHNTSLQACQLVNVAGQKGIRPCNNLCFELLLTITCSKDVFIFYEFVLHASTEVSQPEEVSRLWSLRSVGILTRIHLHLLTGQTEHTEQQEQVTSLGQTAYGLMVNCIMHKNLDFF